MSKIKTIYNFRFGWPMTSPYATSRNDNKTRIRELSMGTAFKILI